MSSLSRTCLLTSSSSSLGKAKQRRIIKIRLLRNGNISFTGVIMRLELQKYSSLGDILLDMTEFMRNSIFLPTAGVRHLYTLSGHSVDHADELTDGETYVTLCLSERFKQVPYCLPNFYDRPGSASSHASSHCKSVCSETGCHSNTSLRSNQETIQPRRITVIREGTSPRKVFRLLLNHRNAVSYDKLMATVNDLIRLDAGQMQSIFTQSGNRVNCLEDFFGYHYIFFAFHKKTNFTFMDFHLTEEEVERVNKLNKIPGSEKLILKVPTIRTSEDFDEISPQIRMKYHIGPTVGNGRYSVVHECYVKAWKDSGMKLAMKIIYKNNDNYKNLLNELSILKAVRHPNIIRLHFIHDAAYKLYLITEFLGEGDLRSALKCTNIPEPEAKSFVKDIVSGLFYIHSLQIVHRDVKPSNLMITRDQYGKRMLKLIDFRSACKSNKLLFEVCGTTFFMAPEMLRGSGYDHGLDIWAAGVILYYMLVQVPPFLGNDEEEDRQLILEGAVDFSSDDWLEVSDGAKDLIVNMLCSDPYERYSAEEVLVHPWMTADSPEMGGGDWEKEEEPTDQSQIILQNQSDDNNNVGRPEVTNYTNDIPEKDETISAEVVFAVQDGVKIIEKVESGAEEDVVVGGETSVDIDEEGNHDKFDSYDNTKEQTDQSQSRNQGEVIEISRVGVDKLAEYNGKCGEGDFIGNDCCHSDAVQYESSVNYVTAKSEGETNDEPEEIEIIDIFKSEKQDRACVDDSASEISYCTEEIFYCAEMNEEESEEENVEGEDSGNENFGETECGESVALERNDVDTVTHEATGGCECETHTPLETIAEKITEEHNIDEHRRKCEGGKLLERKYGKVEDLHCEEVRNVVMKVSQKFIEKVKTERKVFSHCRKIDENDVLEELHTKVEELQNIETDLNRNEESDDDDYEIEEVEEEECNNFEDQDNEEVANRGEFDEPLDRNADVESDETEDLDYNHLDEYHQQCDDVDFIEMEYEDEEYREYADEEGEEEDVDGELDRVSDDDEIIITDEFDRNYQQVCALERQYQLKYGKLNEENEENLLNHEEYDEEIVDMHEECEEDENVSNVDDSEFIQNGSEVDSDEMNFEIGMEEYETMVTEEEEFLAMSDEEQVGDGSDEDAVGRDCDELVDDEDDILESRVISQGYVEEDEVDVYDDDGEVGEGEEDDDDNEWEDATDDL